MIGQEKHPFTNLCIFFLFFTVGFFVSQFFTILMLFPFLGKQVFALSQILASPKDFPEYRYVLLFIQGFSSFVLMIITPWLFINYYYRGKINFLGNIPQPLFFFLTALLVIIAMPFNGWIAEMNQNMQLPEFLGGLERWMAEKEEEIKVLTEYLTDLKSPVDFLVGLLVIAVIPAIGEELIFRGIIQNNLRVWLKNNHGAIWIAAIIFSAIHLQFYGFIPRVLLGALFGYIYMWTKNLLVPIFAHFINNGLTLYLIYLKNMKAIDIDLDSAKDIPWALILFSGIFSIALLFFFKVELNRRNHIPSEEI